MPKVRRGSRRAPRRRGRKPPGKRAIFNYLLKKNSPPYVLKDTDTYRLSGGSGVDTYFGFDYGTAYDYQLGYYNSPYFANGLVGTTAAGAYNSTAASTVTVIGNNNSYYAKYRQMLHLQNVANTVCEVDIWICEPKIHYVSSGWGSAALESIRSDMNNTIGRNEAVSAITYAAKPHGIGTYFTAPVYQNFKDMPTFNQLFSMHKHHHFHVHPSSHKYISVPIYNGKVPYAYLNDNYPVTDAASAAIADQVVLRNLSRCVIIRVRGELNCQPSAPTIISTGFVGLVMEQKGSFQIQQVARTAQLQGVMRQAVTGVAGNYVTAANYHHPVLATEAVINEDTSTVVTFVQT